MAEPKENLSALVRQKLKNMAAERKRPFDEMLRYYAMERFLYRLSVSPYAEKFFLKGGLMLKVLDEIDHRATMDIDLLGRTSNHIDNLRHIISEVVAIPYEQDAIAFDIRKLIFRKAQTAGDYEGVNVSFSARLHTAKIPLLIDIGFNDIIIPQPQKVQYPTLLGMSHPILLGYTLETIIAEKLEAVVKLALANTRIKDFYDLWTILSNYEIEPERLTAAIHEVFANRKTKLKYPTSFSPVFYNSKETQQRWKTFLSSMGKNHIELGSCIIAKNGILVNGVYFCIDANKNIQNVDGIFT